MHLYLAVIIGVILLAVSKYQTKQLKKKTRDILKSSFGKFPEISVMSKERLNIFHELIKSKIKKDDQVDEVTWDDLEMEKIFKRINNCCSFVGEQVLYAKLHEFTENIVSVINFEKLMKFYKENEEKRIETQCIISKLGKRKDSYDVLKYVMNEEDYSIPHLKFYTFMNRALLLSIIVPFILGSSIFTIIPIVIFAINVSIYAMIKNRYDYEIEMISHSLSIIRCAKSLVKGNVIEHEEFYDNIQKGYKKFDKIDKKISGIKSRKTMSLSGDIMYLILDYVIGGTLYDMMVYKNVIGTLNANKEQFIDLFKSIGILDASIAVASYRQSLVMYCNPEIIINEEVEFEDFYHPLVKKPVMNSVDLKRSCIITGSNASGKSTAIKTIMINILLGQSINTCSASVAKFPKTSILTSMAVRDDIENNDSFYLKEIKYLKRIIDQVSNDKMVICAIDEILKGTNMEERIAATTAILEYLITYKCIVLITTHDIMIAEYMKEYYDYYYFRNDIKDDEITFDYKLHEGIADCRNAILLLKHIGFPSSIVEKANLISAGM